MRFRISKYIGSSIARPAIKYFKEFEYIRFNSVIFASIEYFISISEMYRSPNDQCKYTVSNLLLVSDSNINLSVSPFSFASSINILLKNFLFFILSLIALSCFCLECLKKKSNIPITYSFIRKYNSITLLLYWY